MRTVLGSGLILLAFAVAAVVTFFDNEEPYVTVDELVAESSLYAPGSRPEGSPARAAGRMQVRGKVDQATVSRERRPDAVELRFVLRGQEHELPVIYTGLVPDTFYQADAITVGGTLGPQGVFVADAVAVQCPSKYEAQSPPGQAQTPVSPTQPALRPRVDDR